MYLNPSDNEILGFQVICRPGGLTERMGIPKKNLVRLNKMGNEILGRRGLDRQFLDARTFGEGLQAPDREDIQRAQTLGNFVDGLEELLVLLLKRGVELKEIGTFDIPVGEVRLCHQGIRIGQEGLKAFDHGI